MTITERKEGSVLTLVVEGRLDTTTSPELDARIEGMDADVTSLILDCAGMEYISSSGLRVLLKAQKLMNARGSMKLTGVIDMVREVFDVTGFSDILTVE